MQQKGLIPPDIQPRPRSRQENVIRATLGIIVGLFVALFGWESTKDWEWFLALPFFVIVAMWMKLEFIAVWLRHQ